MNVGEAPWSECVQPEVEWKTHCLGLAEERNETNQRINQVRGGIGEEPSVEGRNRGLG
jgi:hypothetical protein